MEKLRDKALQHVLRCFMDMGANQEEIELEKKHLTDDGYLDHWASVTGFYDKEVSGL